MDAEHSAAAEQGSRFPCALALSGTRWMHTECGIYTLGERASGAGSLRSVRCPPSMAPVPGMTPQPTPLARPPKNRPRVVHRGGARHRWVHPLTSFAVVPVFALANAGVASNADTLGDAATNRVAWAIALGLVVGRLLGIAGVSLLGVSPRRWRPPRRSPAATGVGCRRARRDQLHRLAVHHPARLGQVWWTSVPVWRA
jgi:Na+/H+ antiporter 1